MYLHETSYLTSEIYSKLNQAVTGKDKGEKNQRVYFEPTITLMQAIVYFKEEETHSKKEVLKETSLKLRFESLLLH